MKLKLSSSLPDDPKFGNGRVYYDNLVSQLKQKGIDDRVEVSFFPNNQLGQEIEVINSVKPDVGDCLTATTVGPDYGRPGLRR